MAKITPEKIRRLKQTNEVWEGTTRLARFWVTPKNEAPYRPYYLQFVSDCGKVVCTGVKEAHPTPDQVWENLLKTMHRPALGAGRKRRPDTVALDDEQLVQALALRLSKLGIECQYQRQLPYLEAALEGLEKRLNRGFPEVPCLFSIPDVTVPLLERIFTAAAEFYRLEPWKKLPYEVPMEIRYPPDADPRYAVVIGTEGESLGLSVNDNWEDLQTMYAELSPDELIGKISWFALTYEIPIALAFDDLDVIERFDWPIPNESAYPSIARVGSTPDLLPPTRQDLFWLEGVLPVLSEFFKNHLDLDGFGHVRPSKYTFSTQTINGPAEVSLQIPADIV
jgi:hypothetical protein